MASSSSRHDQARAEGKKCGAKRKLEDMSAGKHTRPDNAPKRIKGSNLQQHVSIVKAEDLSSSEDSSDSDSSDSDSSDSDKEPEAVRKPRKSAAKETKITKKIAKAPEPAKSKGKIKDESSDSSDSSDEDSDDSDDSDDDKDKKVKAQKKSSDETKKASSSTAADATAQSTDTPKKLKGKKGKKPKIERTVGKNALKRVFAQALGESKRDKAAFDALIQKSHPNLTAFETNSIEKSWTRKLKKRNLERKIAIRKRHTEDNTKAAAKAISKAEKFEAQKAEQQAKFAEREKQFKEKMAEQGLTPGDEQQQKRLAEMAKLRGLGAW